MVRADSGEARGGRKNGGRNRTSETLGFRGGGYGAATCCEYMVKKKSKN